MRPPADGFRRGSFSRQSAADWLARLQGTRGLGRCGKWAGHLTRVDSTVPDQPPEARNRLLGLRTGARHETPERRRNRLHQHPAALSMQSLRLSVYGPATRESADHRPRQARIASRSARVKRGGDRVNRAQMAKPKNTRAPNRPQEGDVQPCPFCRAIMVFHEPRPDIDPGWFCGCGYEKLVRQSAKPSMKQRQREVAERRAALLRRSMIVRARAARILRKSESLGVPRPGGKNKTK